MERISDTMAQGKSIPTRTVAERDDARRKWAIEILVTEKLEPRGTVTRLARTAVIPMRTATTSPTRRRVEVFVGKQRIANEYPDEIEIPTRMALLKTLSQLYRYARTSWVVVVIQIRMVSSVTTEDAEVGSGYYARWTRRSRAGLTTASKK